MWEQFLYPASLRWGTCMHIWLQVRRTQAYWAE